MFWRKSRGGGLLPASSRSQCTPLLHGDAHWRRRNSVRHYEQLARSHLDIGGHIEARRYASVAGSHAHCAVIVCLAVENMTGCVVHYADERIVSCILNVIAISRALRQTVELRSGYRIIRHSRDH